MGKGKFRWNDVVHQPRKTAFTHITNLARTKNNTNVGDIKLEDKFTRLVKDLSLHYLLFDKRPEYYNSEKNIKGRFYIRFNSVRETSPARFIQIEFVCQRNILKCTRN